MAPPLKSIHDYKLRPGDIERLDAILSGQLTFPSVPDRDVRQTMFHRPLPTVPVRPLRTFDVRNETTSAGPASKDGGAAKNVTVQIEKGQMHEADDTKSMKGQQPGVRGNYDVSRDPASVKFDPDAVSDLEDARKHLDDHWNHWTRNRTEGKNAIPYVMAGIKDDRHASFSKKDQEMWLKSTSGSPKSDKGKSSAYLPAKQGESSNSKATYNHGGVLQTKDQSAYIYGNLPGNTKPAVRLVDRFDKPTLEDKSGAEDKTAAEDKPTAENKPASETKAPRNLGPLVLKNKENSASNTVVIAQSANEKRSSIRKMKRRGRPGKLDAKTSTSQGDNDASATVVKAADEGKETTVTTLSTIKFVGTGTEGGEAFTTTVMNRHLDLSKDDDVITLMQVLAGHGKDKVEGRVEDEQAVEEVDKGTNQEASSSTDVATVDQSGDTAKSQQKKFIFILYPADKKKDSAKE